MLRLRNFPVAKNSMDNKGGGGGIKIFRRSFFVSLRRKPSQGNPSVLCLRIFAVAIQIMDKRAGGIKIFHRRTFISQCRTFS